MFEKCFLQDVLIAYLRESRADTIAIGDAKVDIPMLEYCQTGIVMGNGGEEIKAMADYVTDLVVVILDRSSR